MELKYIVYYRTGKCIGRIITANIFTMNRIQKAPSRFGFEPYDIDNDILWGKYYIKNIIMSMNTNYLKIYNNAIIHISGIIFLDSYYLLQKIDGRIRWVKI